MAHGKNWKDWPTDIPGFWLPLFDPYSMSLTTITEDHRLIHDGMMFSVTDLASGVANGAFKRYLLRAGVAAHFHLRKADFSTDDGPFVLRVYESPTVTADGTPSTPVNHNRVSSNVAQLAAFIDPTVSANGTQIHVHKVYGTGAPGTSNAVAASAQFDNEIILKAGFDYLFELENLSGGPLEIHAHFTGYEPSYLRSNA